MPFNTVKIHSETDKKAASTPKEKNRCSLCSDDCISKLFTKPKFLRISFYKNNIPFFTTISVYVIIQIGLIILQLYLYSNVNNFVKAARVGGILLQFNSCLVILIIMRRFTTWLFNSRIGRKVLAFEQFIEFHKFIGFFILILSLEHTISHCLNLYYLSGEYLDKFQNNNDMSFFSNSSNMSILFNNSSPLLNKTKTIPYGRLLFLRDSNIGWLWALAMPTGWVLLFILTIMIIFALPCIRRKGLFELFYYTHWLHVLYYIFLFIHCANFWKWFILPLVIILCERIYALIRVRSLEANIVEVNLLSSRVTNLVISRPKTFKFKSGDYIFVKIPSIAKNEWHPFTISSAPEEKEIITLHVRSLGNWTNKLYDHFDHFSRFNMLFKEVESNTQRYGKARSRRGMSSLVAVNEPKSKKISTISKEAIQEDDVEEEDLNQANKIEDIVVKILIDGPYGTASRNISKSQHAVLIAGGIGVTPFASILQSLWFKYIKRLKVCEKCNHEWYEDFEEKTLRKVDFVWVNRDYQAFEWFIELLGQLELQQLKAQRSSKKITERFINMHLFMTSAKKEKFIKPNGIDSDLNQDFSLTLKPKRPDLDSLFQGIKNENKGKVEVFFCGNPEFGRLVQQKSIEYKFKFAKEYF